MGDVSQVELTDAQKEKQPLLIGFGIILAPEELDHAAYLELSWALHIARVLHPNKVIELRCCGRGGDGSRAFAVADLIQHDGQVAGIAVGRISSGHSIIWGACQARYAYPNSIVSIHQARTDWINEYSQQDFENHSESIVRLNERMIRLYSAISNKGHEYWHDLLFRGGRALVDLDYEKLIALEMAKPSKELRNE